MQANLKAGETFADLFRLFVAPVRYAPSITEHVPLNSKSSCKNMARASGRCKQYALTELGAPTEKIRFPISIQCVLTFGKGVIE